MVLLFNYSYSLTCSFPCFIKPYKLRRRYRASPACALQKSRSADWHRPWFEEGICTDALWSLQGINQTATERACDVIILDAEPLRGWKRLVYQHTAEAVMAHTTLPLLLVNRLTT